MLGLNFPAVWTSAGFLTSLSCRLLICKMAIIMLHRFTGLQEFGVARVVVFIVSAEYHGSEEENKTLQASHTFPGLGVLSGLQLW